MIKRKVQPVWIGENVSRHDFPSKVFVKGEPFYYAFTDGDWIYYKRRSLFRRTIDVLLKALYIFILWLLIFCTLTYVSGCDGNMMPDRMSIGYAPPYYETTPMWRGVNISFGWDW